ncbi:MAG: hypothetical protein M5U35_16515 [Roseovarius sp.]|nr:hypothetical protein [Roseovarius sp.]
MRILAAAAAAVLMTAQPPMADDISDTLQNALDAYQDGDAQYALEELDYARQLLLALRTDALVEFLPAAPDGWSREVNTEMNAGLSMMGGGTGAEATYEGEGQRITITIMADNPMVGAMGGMIANAAMLGAKVERIGREKFMVQDGEVSGLLDKRILVKGSGDDLAAVLDLLGKMDFNELKRFGT